MGFKAFILSAVVFAVVGTYQVSWAQDLDDVEAEMDTVISESDAAKSAEEYTRKRKVEEKQKLEQAEEEAIETAEKAQKVKDTSILKVADLEKQTAAFISERKLFDNRTKKLNEQIAKYEAMVKAAEEKLTKAKEERRLAVEQHTQSKNLLAQKKMELKKLEEERKSVMAENRQAKRNVASIAKNMPGKMINMAKDCIVHREMSKESATAGKVKKGQRISLAKVTQDGWFYAKGTSLKGFIHKNCE
ncbi:MAG: hypothetical protein AABZ31_09275 [Bdellovibrionota bacterium]